MTNRTEESATRPKGKAEFEEGTAAFDRFRDAMKKIVSVPKAAIADQERPAEPAKRKKRRNR